MPSTAAATQAIHFHWFRHGDLRLHDNPALCRAVEAASKNDVGTKGVVPIFCFDPRIFGQDATSEFGSLKCGPLRAKFILESVTNLRTNLEAHGSGLVVAHGKPEEIFPSILNSFVADGGDPIPRVFCQEEVASEELRVDKALKRELKRKAGSLETVWGSTLYEPDDLPFEGKVLGMPDVFTPFRNKVEKKCNIAPPLPVPSKQKLALPFDSFTEKIEKCSLTYMPTLKELGYDDEDIEKAATHDVRGVMEFKGGETAALARVKDYIWDKDRLRIYFDTRNGMLGADYSTKFSPWLAHGCLSPRFVAQECRRYEEERVENKSTYWVVFELLWRDFFKFFAQKHGNQIFFLDGILGQDAHGSHPNSRRWGLDKRHLQAWKEGRTGYPLGTLDATNQTML
jgi:deoxyribodipyrimidine photo-lyase